MYTDVKSGECLPRPANSAAGCWAARRRMAATRRSSRCESCPLAMGNGSARPRSWRIHGFAVGIRRRASTQGSDHRGPSPRPRSRRSGIRRLRTAPRPLSRSFPRNCQADRTHSRHWCPVTRPRLLRGSRRRHGFRSTANAPADSSRVPRRSANHGCQSFLADLTATLHQIVREASGQHRRHENHRVAQTTGEPDERRTGAETNESPANAEYRSTEQ